MQSIAFFNNKGGVGKTTLLCNVAAYCAQHLQKQVCIIDADPQCNATQYIFDDAMLDSLYGGAGFTIYRTVEPLTLGEGFAPRVPLTKSRSFGVSVLPGDPQLALMEDFLAQEWVDAKSGGIRGMKSSLVFAELLNRLRQFDLVFIDVSPSLGAINRSILLASQYFLSPTSIDIFSLKAFENIAKWINDWSEEWKRGQDGIRDPRNVPKLPHGDVQFLGYVTQQYLAKRDASGNRRGVSAYETIRSQIDDVIRGCGLDHGIPGHPIEIGTVPNLFSLIPMSQSSNKPVFALQSKDGVVGAHFAKVKDAQTIFGSVARGLLERIND
ncbi:MAG: hypothetical protein BGN89_01335 [Alphaproteobacteria bacterium 64-6]|nr:MAG: hypothetical protein BGN89_01335 [Alphaproteobacteria bacterium 64-6]